MDMSEQGEEGCQSALHIPSTSEQQTSKRNFVWYADDSALMTRHQRECHGAHMSRKIEGRPRNQIMSWTADV